MSASGQYRQSMLINYCINIVYFSQLVIKNVVDQSLKYGRQLEGDNLALHQLFVILDLALKHGLKNSRKNLLGGRREVWDLVQTVERRDSSAGDITTTARQLSTVTTSWGRVRAWMRLAVMQKKLADYLKVLVDDRVMMSEYYESEALMMSEEAVLLCGLLVSLNIVDCNLCLKEEDLDGQEAVIDLTYYLRRKEDIGRDGTGEEIVGDKDLSSVIDQKSYVEEVNRNLAANIMNLEARIDSMTKMNALLKEDVALHKRKTEVLEQENIQLKTDMEAAVASNRAKKRAEISFQNLDPKKEEEWEAKLKQLRHSNQELEKELILEVQMKAEMEMAMKLLEKDVHEKQDTIVSLRSQLEDVKTINLEMFTKLAESEKALDYKGDMIQKLEKKTSHMAETLDKIEKKFNISEKTLQSSKTENSNLAARLNVSESKLFEVESDLKIEREWRERLQESSVNDREMIHNLKQETEFLKQVSNDYEHLRQDNTRLKNQIKESDQTLEELGQQLSWSKLQITSMKDEASSSGAGQWRDDSEVDQCGMCFKEFNIGRRRHHCRNCGGIFCDKCSDNKMKLPSAAKPLR